MTSPFTFLQVEWPAVYEAAAKAAAAAHPDPRTACFYARRALELAVAWAYKSDASLRLPYQDNLSALIHEPTFKAAAGEAVFSKARVINQLGNLAVHSHRPIQPLDALTAVRELFHVGYWLARTYARGTKPAPGLAFDASALPRTAPIPRQTIEQLQTLEAALRERDEKLSALLADKSALDEELKWLRAEVAEARRVSSTLPDTHDYSEAETRDYFIDLLLKEAGWALDQPRDREFEVTGMPNAQGKGAVDYVLWGDDGKPLAMVEAKRTKKSAAIGQQQARLYADCLESQFERRPVIFYSNASPVNLVTERDTEGRVLVSTYQTMMGLIDETKDGQRRFGVGHFDLIVIDEAHRSVYQKYRAIFGYFDALLVGLTATPKDEIDINTYGLFDLERGVPTDAYGLEDAVKDGFLVPPRAVSVPLKFHREGITYDELSENEKEQWDALEWDEDGRTPDRVEAEAVNQWLFNKDTVDKVLEHLMTRGQTVAGGDRLGKAIVFAKNQAHAEFIAQRFDVNYPHYNGARATLAHEVAGLPSAQEPEDEEARRFDLLILSLQLAVLRTEPAFRRLRDQVKAIAGLLEEKAGIPMVRQQLALILEIQSDDWWQNVTTPMLEHVRKRLRALIKLIDRQRRKPIYTDFEDHMGSEAAVDLPGFAAPDSFERFRAKARAFLKEHENHVTIHKLRMNRALTPSDLDELEGMLTASGVGAPDDVRKAKEESQGLGLFVRSLVGLDREAAKQAFAGFLAGKTPAANQIEFVNLIIDHLTEHGVMGAALLYESPFTFIAPRGPDDIFTSTQIDELIALLDHITATAVAA